MPVFAWKGDVANNIRSRIDGFRNWPTPWLLSFTFIGAVVMFTMGYIDVYDHLDSTKSAQDKICDIIGTTRFPIENQPGVYESNRPGSCHYTDVTFLNPPSGDADADLTLARGQCASYDADCGAKLIGTHSTDADNQYKCTNEPAEGSTDFFQYDFIPICGIQCTYQDCKDHVRETNTFFKTIFWMNVAALGAFVIVITVNTLFYSSPPSTEAGKDWTFGNSVLIRLLQTLVIFLNIFLVSTTGELYEHDDTTDEYGLHPATMVFWGWLIFICYSALASGQFGGDSIASQIGGRADASAKAKAGKAVRSIHW